MTDTLQLFNYTVLTDSATGHEFYAIDRQELTTVATVSSLKSANNGFTKGYFFGLTNGIFWTILAGFVINFIFSHLQKRQNS